MTTLRDLTIRQKLLVITIVTIAVALVLAGIGIVLMDRALFLAGMQKDLTALARIVGDNTTAALTFDDPEVAKEILGALKARPHVVAACIYKADGTEFARYAQAGVAAGCEGSGGREEVKETSRGLTATHPIVLNDRRIGTLMLDYDLGEVAERMKLYVGIVAAILLASSLAAFLFSSRLREIIATPISRVSQAAASVSKTGDYSVRVQSYSRDELGVLADAFNEMLARIQSRDIEVQNARNSLQTTLTSIGDAVISTDIEGRVVFANPVAQQLLRLKEPAGRHIDEVFRIINEKTRERMEAPIHRVLRDGQIAGMTHNTVLLAGDGTEIPIDDSAAPIRDARAQMTGVVLIFRDISSRRATEKLLETQAEELRQRAHLMEPVHCFVRDLKDRVVYWNPGAEDLYGYTTEEAVGEVSHKLLKTVFHRPLEDIHAQLMGEGEWDGEMVHTRRDGDQVTVASHWTLHRGVDGKPLAVLEVNVDITARKRAEGTLQAALHQLQVITENMTVGVAQCSTDMRFEWVSKTYAERLGRAPEEFTGRHIEEMLGSEAYETILPRVERVLRGENVEYETVVNYESIGKRSVHVTYGPTFGLDQQVDGWIAVVADTTERVKAEEAVRKSEERLATILQHLPVGVGVIDTAGHVVMGNPVWKRYLHGDFPAVEEMRKEDPVSRALRGDNVLPGIEFQRKEEDGSEKWTRISAVPFKDAGGQIVGALAVLQDIEEERRAEERRAELLVKERALVSERALRETEAELARVVRALSVGELATSIAHEINQPLAGVVTNAAAGQRWLSAETPNVEEARTSLALIARDGNRASAVIRRIREFLKKEGPSAVLLDINDVVEEAVTLARGELVKRGVALRLELGDAGRVRGDRIQLQQVVLNLVMNGAEAMTQMDGTKALLVATKGVEDGGAVVAVTDSGLGMKAEDMPRMFDAFFTTKSSGMGMGLSISRTIVEAHGGKIWAELNGERGMTVQFGLPAESAAAGASSVS